MDNRYSYGLLEKIKFYSSYFFYKLIIPLEVTKPKPKMWWYELIYSLAKFKNYSVNLKFPFRDNTIQTKFGIFKIRPNTSDAACVSPAFERRDLNHLLKLLRNLTLQNKKVIFCDVGADLGSYSITVANRFKNVDIKSFEPIEENCQLLRENLALNKAAHIVEVFPVALTDKDNSTMTMQFNVDSPGSSSLFSTRAKTVKNYLVRTTRLDSIL